MNEEKHRSLLKKLVANARAIITEEVGLSIGCSKMNKTLNWLEPFEKAVSDKINVFKNYDEESQFIPSGTARLYCSKEAFRKYDDALDLVNRKYRKEIIEACFEIIDKYDEKKAIKL